MPGGGKPTAAKKLPSPYRIYKLGTGKRGRALVLQVRALPDEPELVPSALKCYRTLAQIRVPGGAIAKGSHLFLSEHAARYMLREGVLEEVAAVEPVKAADGAGE